MQRFRGYGTMHYFVTRNDDADVSAFSTMVRNISLLGGKHTEIRENTHLVQL